MTPTDAQQAPLTRRERRRRAQGLPPSAGDGEQPGAPEATDTGAPETADAGAPEAADAESAGTAPVAVWAENGSAATALTWVDPDAVAAESASIGVDEKTPADSAEDLLADAPRRILRPGLLVPIGAVVALAAAYSVTALTWPLHELPPTVRAVEVTAAPAAPAELTWPGQGSAAIGVAGVGVASHSDAAIPIASLTKVVSVMLVLEEMPLQPGEQGPSFEFTRRDSNEYWSYLRDNQSALDVPVGGSLTQYQMLQGILLGSANNYIDRLADEIWGSDAEFAAAAELWLNARGLDDITIVTPSGRDAGNVATPEALTKLAAIAMANPVFAEIVGTESVDLPGAGTVRNSNKLLGDPGVVGVKTGTLDHRYNLLSAKDVEVGDDTVRVYAAVLGQEDGEARLAVSRQLYAEVEEALRSQAPAVDAGTVVGEIDTRWGERVHAVTDADAEVVLWNGAAATTDAVFDLGEATAKGAEVGTLTVTGPIDTAAVPVTLSDEIEGPSAWWRLTHPLELFGVVD